MRPFQGLIVWQRAHALTLRIHGETNTFPKAGMFGLTNQMRRSASSIAFNMVEGVGAR